MEIERKFLVKELPDLSAIKPIRYERYFLSSDAVLQERIQRKGEKYEIETKRVVEGLGGVMVSKKQKSSLTKEQFEDLKQGKEDRGIVRDSYNISLNPNISIKIYHDKYKGLVRAEVEFISEEDAKRYIPESWMGKEITSNPLGMDAKLVELTEKEFQLLLSSN